MGTNPALQGGTPPAPPVFSSCSSVCSADSEVPREQLVLGRVVGLERPLLLAAGGEVG